MKMPNLVEGKIGKTNKMELSISYGRVSSEGQRDNTSISEQHRVNKTLALQRSITIIQNFSDISTGRNDIRIGLEEAFMFCQKWNDKRKSEKVKYLLVFDWERWFRNKDLSAVWRIKFHGIGVEVNCVTDWIDYGDPGHIILHSVKEAMAQTYSMKISKNTKKGLYATAKMGYWIGSYPPLGMTRSNYLDERGKRLLLEDPETGPLMRKAFEMIASGTGTTETFRKLGGVKKLKSYNNFSRSLRRKIYINIVEVKGNPSNPVAYPDIEVVGKGPSLTTPEIFYKVQEILSGNSHPSKTVESDSEHPIKRVLRCPICGYYTTSEKVTKRRKNKKNGKVVKKYYFYYRCGSNPSHWRVSRDLAHKHLKFLFEDLSLSEQAIELFREKAKGKIKEITKGIPERIGKQKTALMEANERLNKGLSLMVDGVISQDEYNILKAKLFEINANIKRLEEFKKIQGGLEERIIYIASHLGLFYEKAKAQDLNQALKIIFPQGLIFDKINLIYRTRSINRLFQIITASKTEPSASLIIEAEGSKNGKIGPKMDSNSERGERRESPSKLVA